MFAINSQIVIFITRNGSTTSKEKVFVEGTFDACDETFVIISDQFGSVIEVKEKDLVTAMKNKQKALYIPEASGLWEY